jgi:hypothetical protein
MMWAVAAMAMSLASCASTRMDSRIAASSCVIFPFFLRYVSVACLMAGYGNSGSDGCRAPAIWSMDWCHSSLCFALLKSVEFFKGVLFFVHDSRKRLSVVGCAIGERTMVLITVSLGGRTVRLPQTFALDCSVFDQPSYKTGRVPSRFSGTRDPGKNIN